MSSSALQRYTRSRLEMIPQRNEIQENIRPDWMIAQTGERLELDFFIPSLNLAIEVQGKQHFEFVEFFHQDRHGYNAQIKRDKAKRELCQKIGIRLVEICLESDADNLALSLCYPNISPNDYKTKPIEKITPPDREIVDFKEYRKREQEKLKAQKLERRLKHEEKMRAKKELKLQRQSQLTETAPAKKSKKTKTLRIKKQKLLQIDLEELNQEIDYISYLILSKRGMIEHEEYKKCLRQKRGTLRMLRERAIRARDTE